MASRWSHVSVTRAQIYVDRNPPRSGRRKRTKGSAATERHIYLDFITDGEARLTALRASDALPMPITFVWTLPGRFTDLWQVDGFSIAPQRSAIMLLAIAIGSGPTLRRLQSGHPVPGIPELQVRFGVSRHHRIPQRFQLESRCLPTRHSLGERHALALFNSVAKAFWKAHPFRSRLGVGCV
jgi:hypothetical protein